MKKIIIPVFFCFLLSACVTHLTELDEKAWERFRLSLRDPRQTGLVRGPEELPYLIHALDDSNPQVRFNAAQDLLMMGKQASPASEALVRRENDPNPETRAKVREVLVVLGITPKANASKPVPQVIAAPANPSTPPASANNASANKLPIVKTSPGAREGEINPFLVRRLSVRTAMAYARQHLEKTNKQRLIEWENQLPYLSKVLQTGLTEERLIAVKTLGNLSPFTPQAVPLLIFALNDLDLGVKQEALKFLTAIVAAEAKSKIQTLMSQEELRPDVMLALDSLGAAELSKRSVSPEVRARVQRLPQAHAFLRSADPSLTITLRSARVLCGEEAHKERIDRYNFDQVVEECARALNPDI